MNSSKPHLSNEQNPAQLQAVVFDLDGLIVNSEDLYVMAGKEILARHGKTYDEELRQQMMGRVAQEALRIMIDYHELETTVEKLEDETRKILYQLMDTSLQAMPGLWELLDRLEEAGIVKAIATSAKHDYAIDVLSRLNIQDRFTMVLGAEHIRQGKPAPDIYQLAAKELNLEPSQTMVLEDSGNGCQAGVAAGAFTVAVPNRHTVAHDFSGTQFIAETLADPRIGHALEI